MVCKLPGVYQFTNEETKPNESRTGIRPAPFCILDVALTNDGRQYSNSLRLTVYDTKCQEFRSDGTTTQNVAFQLFDVVIFDLSQALSLKI